jgi:hypothetical protein
LVDEFSNALKEYREFLSQQELFVNELMPALSHVFIPGHAPSHEQRPYLKQALSNELVFEIIQKLGIVDHDVVMRRLCN